MKQKMFFVLLFSTIVALPLLACLLFGQARLVVKPEAISQVDARLAQLARDGIFSGSALIAQDGVVFLSKGYGLADRVQGIPNTPQTRFHLGSMTKQFTAMGIMILESQGKLSLQGPICNYITDCPAAWQGVTIHHLLTNTSGLSRLLSSKLYTVIDRGTSDPLTPTEQVDYLGLTREWPVGAQPGEQFVYNNFGYILLVHIIQEVSGLSYADFLEQTIFTPLNMHNSGYPESASGVALIYPDRDTQEGMQIGSGPFPDGSGNLYSSCEDLLLWDQALYTDLLLPRAKLDQMFTPFSRESPQPGFGYGYGWLVTKVLGRPILMGAGGGRSFVTAYFRLPADGLTLIVLTNQGDEEFMAMMTGIVVAIASALFLSDLIFALSAIAFMLLLAVLLAAQREHQVRTTWVIGILWSLLAAPFALVFSRYLAQGRGVGTLLPLSLVLLFMLAKTLLDFVLKMEFRRNRITRLATLALMCLALFSLIWIAFSIHPSWGIPVLIAFGILAVSLFFMYRDEIKENDQMVKQYKLIVLIVLATLTLAACGLGNTRLSPAEGAAYAAEVDDFVETMLVGRSKCDFTMYTRGFDLEEWKGTLDESAWQQECETGFETGAYQSKTLDHVEDRQELRVVIYQVVFENVLDATLSVYFYIDDPDHLIVGYEINY